MFPGILLQSSKQSIPIPAQADFPLAQILLPSSLALRDSTDKHPDKYRTRKLVFPFARADFRESLRAIQWSDTKCKASHQEHKVQQSRLSDKHQCKVCIDRKHLSAEIVLMQYQMKPRDRES